MELIVGCRQQLTVHHVQFFSYNILRGLKFLHSAKIVHGSIQPQSILSNANDDHVIVDLGTATIAGASLRCTSPLRYQAPEQLLGAQSSTLEMDMWSVGCVLAEMFLRKPLFQEAVASSDTVEKKAAPVEDDAERQLAFLMGLHSRLGSDSLVQLLNSNDVVQPVLELTTGPPAHSKAVLQSQISVLGLPSEEELDSLGRRAKQVFPELLPQPGQEWEDLFATADAAGLDLLRRMLTFDPKKRPTAAEALDHPFLADVHGFGDEPSFDKDVDLAAVHATIFSSSLDEVQAKLEAISTEYAQRRV